MNSYINISTSPYNYFQNSYDNLFLLPGAGIINLPDIRLQNIEITFTNNSGSNIIVNDVNGVNVMTVETGNSGNIFPNQIDKKWTIVFKGINIPTGVGWSTSGNTGLASTGKLGTTDVNDSFKIIQGGFDVIEIKQQGVVNMLNGNVFSYGNPTGFGIFAIKQPTLLNDTPTGSGSSILFEDPGSQKSYYIGYAASDSFGIFLKTSALVNQTVMTIAPSNSDLKSTLSLTGGTRRIILGSPSNTASIIIKQPGQVTQTAGGSTNGLMFENNGSIDAFYMGYAVGGVFAIFNRAASGIYTRIAEFGSGGVRFLTQLDMGGSKIISMADPTTPQEGATKNYVDNSAKTNVWETNFGSNNPGTGDVITQQLTGGTTGANPFNAFNATAAAWNLTGFVSPASVTIQFARQRTLTPSAVICVTGVTGASNFNNWNISYSNDGSVFNNIGSSTTALSPTTQVTLNNSLTSAVTYSYLRFTGVGVTSGTTPGINYWQCFDKWS